MEVHVYDPWANPSGVKNEYGIDIVSGKESPDLKKYSAVVLAVSHTQFKNLNIYKSSDQVVFDMKGFLEKSRVDARL